MRQIIVVGLSFERKIVLVDNVNNKALQKTVVNKEINITIYMTNTVPKYECEHRIVIVAESKRQIVCIGIETIA